MYNTDCSSGCYTRVEDVCSAGGCYTRVEDVCSAGSWPEYHANISWLKLSATSPVLKLESFAIDLQTRASMVLT